MIARSSVDSAGVYQKTVPEAIAAFSVHGLNEKAAPRDAALDYGGDDGTRRGIAPFSRDGFSPVIALVKARQKKQRHAYCRTLSYFLVEMTGLEPVAC